MRNKLKRVLEWYILGKYHCDKCPYSWSEWSYDGDGDAGCYIFGDLRDSCRLLPPFRTLIGWPKRKHMEYFETHEYDGIAEWYEQEEKNRDKFNELVSEFLERYELCWKDEKGEYHPIDKEIYINYEAWRIRRNYEDYSKPFEAKTLRQEWMELLRKTWNSFTAIFKPYFCK